MADAELHYPPGADPNPPAPDPQPEPTPPAPEPTPEDPAPEPKPEEKPDEKPDEPSPEVPLPKPRSIYDDLKDKKQEVRAWKQMAVSALKTQGIELQGNETPEQIQALIEKHKTPDAPPTPPAPAPSTPSNELEAYAKEHELDATALSRLATIIAKQIPAAQLSEADRKELSDLKAWKADNEAKEQRAAEDGEVLSAAPTVKTQLDIHDDAELANVMKEIVKLSHTEAFHDKEVDYIVWKNKDALSKLVSPKKPSFESGGQQGETAPENEPDFSSGKGITPGMAEKAANEKRGSALEIRRGK